MTAKAENGRRLGRVVLSGGNVPELFLSVQKHIAASQKLRRYVELALLLIIAMLLAKLTWAIIAPLPLPQAEIGQAPRQTEQSHSMVNLDPFAVGEVSEPTQIDNFDDTSLAETSLDLTLYGTWSDAEGGTAFIGEGDNPQKRVRVGDEISSGVRLQDVRENWVVISRGGIAESLWMNNRKQPASSPPVTASAPKTDVFESVSSLNEIFRFSIDQQNGGRIVLRPGSQPEKFTASGFVSGDVLVAIDDAPVDLAALTSGSLAAEFFDAQPVRVTVERDGQTKTINVEFNTGADSSDDDS